jgi:hypothetical protein
MGAFTDLKISEGLVNVLVGFLRYQFRDKFSVHPKFYLGDRIEPSCCRPGKDCGPSQEGLSSDRGV